MDFSNLNAMKNNSLGKMVYNKAKEKGFSLGLNSFLGTAGAGIYGVALAHSDQVNSFFQNRFGFKLFEDADRCKINDIPLDHCPYPSRFCRHPAYPPGDPIKPQSLQLLRSNHHLGRYPQARQPVPQLPGKRLVGPDHPG